MLEKETDLILQLLTEQTIGTQESITLNQAQGSAIPKNIKRYLRCEVVRWLALDLHSTPSFSHIPAGTKTSRVVTETLLHSLAREYVFTREEFLVTLENAVHFLENFLCRPQWTLEHFMFEDDERVASRKLLAKLDYLIDYWYFPGLIERTVRKNGWIEIHRDGFRALVARIDDQVVKQHNARELALLAKPIYDFLFLEDAPMDRAIPIKPLLVFFEDKKMRILREYIERVAEIRGHTELSLSELGEIIEKLYVGDVGKSDAHPLPPVEHQAAAASGLTDFVDSPLVVTDSDGHAGKGSGTIEETPNRLIEEDSFEPTVPVHGGREEDPSTATLESENASPATEASPTIDRAKTNITLSLTYAGLKETQESQPLPLQTRPNGEGGRGLADLQSLITEEQRDRFISKVFNRDDAYYAETIDALNKTQAWKEASLYLNELYQRSGLDPYADEVIEFTDAIHRRYSAEANNPQ
jgi:hypothetical protein